MQESRILLAGLRAVLPDCPHCKGTGRLINPFGDIIDPCDCWEGKVPPNQWIDHLCAQVMTLEESLEVETCRRAELLSWAWTVIANVSEGNWDRQTDEWHSLMSALPKAGEPEPFTDPISIVKYGQELERHAEDLEDDDGADHTKDDQPDHSHEADRTTQEGPL